MKKYRSIDLLKALPTSIKGTALVFSSSNMECIACTGASYSALCPARTWSIPTDEMASSRTADMTNLPVMQLNVSPTPTDRRRGCLSNGPIYSPKLVLNLCLKPSWYKLF